MAFRFLPVYKVVPGLHNNFNLNEDNYSPAYKYIEARITFKSDKYSRSNWKSMKYSAVILGIVLVLILQKKILMIFLLFCLFREVKLN